MLDQPQLRKTLPWVRVACLVGVAERFVTLGVLLNIRPYREKSDLSELQKVYRNSRKTTFTWLEETNFQMNDFQRDTEGEVILVIESTKLIGFSSIFQPDNFLHHLYISPSATGNGYGSLLLESTVEKFGTPMRLKCLVQNQNALSFYTERNWNIIGSGTGEDGDFYEMELERSA